MIHQDNKGLAEVRNVGIREAKGEWILLVDGDDWIDPDIARKCYDYSMLIAGCPDTEYISQLCKDIKPSVVQINASLYRAVYMKFKR